MGWNSFDCFGTAVFEHEVLANAEVLARELRPAGFDTVVVDGGWAHPHAMACTNPHQAAEFNPHLAMDLEHRLVPAPERFPSAAGGRGFQPLAERIHGLGLKFGIHIMRGFPRQACYPGYPTRHGRLLPSTIADREDTCTWLNHMFGVRPGEAGQRYYDSLFELYAAWGVDFVKADDLTSPYRAAEIEMIDRARLRCGRPMVLSLSPGPCPRDAADHVARHAEMFRLSGDFWDCWAHLRRAFDLCASWNAFRRPGVWPDPDMLPLGRLSRRGPVGPEHDSYFTDAEARSLVTLWSLFHAPLFVGGDLTVMTRPLLDLLRHAALQDLRGPAWRPDCLALDDHHALWRTTSAHDGRQYLAWFNLGEEPARWDPRRLLERPDAWTLHDALGAGTAPATDGAGWAVGPHDVRLVACQPRLLSPVAHAAGRASAATADPATTANAARS